MSDLCNPMAVVYQVPLSMKLPRQEYWSGLLFLSLGDLSDPGIEPESLASPALTGIFFTTSATWEALPLFLCSEKNIIIMKIY